MKKITIISLLAATSLLAAGCSKTTGPGTGSQDTPVETFTATSAAPQDANHIQIKNYEFIAPQVTVKKGTTVTWTNTDLARHTITGDDGKGPQSQLFGQGETFSYTFNETGTYNYHCEPHPYMKGTVTVTE